MIKFMVLVKPVSMFTVGGPAGLELGPDVPFVRLYLVEGDSRTRSIYIPGSSFKGALRSAASRVAEAFGLYSCGEVEPERIKEAHKNVDMCHVCELFGAPYGASSKIFVDDLLPVTKKPLLLSVTRVRIDDAAGNAVEGGLYTIEHVLRGQEFSGYIRLIRFDRALLKLLLLALAELRFGRVGRSGVVDIKISDTSLLRNAASGDELLIRLIESLERWAWF